MINKTQANFLTNFQSPKATYAVLNLGDISFSWALPFLMQQAFPFWLEVERLHKTRNLARHKAGSSVLFCMETEISALKTLYIAF